MTHPTYPPTPGADLRTLREDAGVSQEDVAAYIPTTRQAIGRWERSARVPFVKAEQYRAALVAAVKARAAA